MTQISSSNTKTYEIKGPNKDYIEYKMNSFFAGIGGFDRGFEQNHFKTVYQCEINEFCQSILTRHWPNVKKDFDINRINPENIPDADVWCGGFPCQDVSVACGTGRTGLNGSRSGLFFRFAELIEHCKPNVVLLENVTGLLNSNDGRDFRVVLNTFLSMGYSISWRTLNSRYFGVPQSRPRVYICAWLSNPSNAAYVLFEPDGGPTEQLDHKGFLDVTGDLKNGPIVPRIAYCLAATSGRHTGTDWSRTYVVYPERVRRLTPIECEGIQGFPRDWTLPTGDEHGTPDEIDTLRYTALGNAVSVPVIKWISNRVDDALNGKANDLKDLEIDINPIADQEIGSNGSFENMKEIKDTGDLLAKASPEFQDPKSRVVLYLSPEDIKNENAKYKWPAAGIAWKNFCIAAKVPTAPSEIINSQLFNLIEKDAVDERYYLSPNAAEGILRRVNGQGRKLFSPLDNVLKKLASQKEYSSEEVIITKEIALDEQSGDVINA